MAYDFVITKSHVGSGLNNGLMIYVSKQPSRELTPQLWLGVHSSFDNNVAKPKMLWCWLLELFPDCQQAIVDAVRLAGVDADEVMDLYGMRQVAL